MVAVALYPCLLLSGGLVLSALEDVQRVGWLYMCSTKLQHLACVGLFMHFLFFMRYHTDYKSILGRGVIMY